MGADSVPQVWTYPEAGEGREVALDGVEISDQAAKIDGAAGKVAAEVAVVLAFVDVNLVLGLAGDSSVADIFDSGSGRDGHRNRAMVDAACNPYAGYVGHAGYTGKALVCLGGAGRDMVGYISVVFTVFD